MKLSAVLLLSFLGLAMCSSCPWTQVKLGRLNRESIKQLEDMDPFAKECIDENVNLMFSESLCGPPADTQDQVVSVAYEALKGVKMLLQNCTTWKRQQLDLLKNYLSQQVSALHSCVEKMLGGTRGAEETRYPELETYFRKLSDFVNEKEPSRRFCAWEVVKKEVKSTLKHLQKLLSSNVGKRR